jgi:RHS repeat-associated protein
MLIYLTTFLLLISLVYPVQGEQGPVETSYDQISFSNELIEQYIEDGYSIDDIKNAIIQNYLTGEDIETLLIGYDTTPVNQSSTAISEVDADLPIPPYVYASSTTTEKKPFVFVKTKIDESPFSIQKNNESISSLTGGLTIQETDLTLPGRNGLSFQLKRIYDSNDSQLYEMGIEEGSGNYSYDVYVDLDYSTVKKGYKAVDPRIRIEKKQTCAGTVLPDKETNAETFYSKIFYSEAEADKEAEKLKTYINDSGWGPCIEENQGGPAYKYRTIIKSTGQSFVEQNDKYNDLSPRQSYGSHFDDNFNYHYQAESRKSELNSSRGKKYGESGSGDTIFYISQSPNAKVEPVFEGYDDDDNKVISSSMDIRFPIGKGWTWDIPYIHIPGDGKKYLNLGSQGTYEVDNNTNQLMAYPWKDLTFSNDSSQVVNGIPSVYKLKSIQGISHYFDAKGYLIKIADNYSNGINFYYGKSGTYQNVLTKIEDAIGNFISIAYSDLEVKLTKANTTDNKNQTVTYSKIKPDSRYDINTLGYVTDSLGRKTTYKYDFETAMFNLLGTSPTNGKENPYALLKEITYPTGGKTQYLYQPKLVTRYTGTNSVNQSYRIGTRMDINPQKNGDVYFNVENYDYGNDDASSNYGQSKTVTTTIDDGAKQTAIETKKVQPNSSSQPIFYKTKEITTYNQLTKKAVVESENEYDIMEKVVSYTYDEARKLPVPDKISTVFFNKSKITDPFETTLSRKYDDYGNILSETNQLGVTTIYNYDPNTHLLSNVTEPIKAGVSKYTEYRRTPEGSINRILIKENGSAGQTVSDIQYSEFDQHGNYQKIDEKDDTKTNSTKIEYDSTYGFAFPTSQTNTITDVNGNQSTIRQSAKYDKLTGNVVEYTDGNGNVTNYQYDLLERLDKVINPDQSTLQYQYKDTENQIILTDEEGKKSLTAWNTLGMKYQEGYLDKGNNPHILMEYKHDSNGWLSSQKDSRNHLTNYTNDAWGRRVVTVNPTGATTQVVFDDVVNMKEITDPEGNRTKESFDKLNRLEKTEEYVINEKEEAFQPISTYSLDYVGNILTETDGRNYTKKFEYDVLNRLTKVTQPNEESTQYFYTLTGNLKKVKHPDGDIEEKVYDELGRIIKEVNPKKETTKFEYDGNHNLTKKVDREGKVFTYQYSYRNLLTKDIGPKETISYGFYQNGQKSSVEDAAGITTYQYESDTGYLSKVTYPDGRTIQHQYDSQGNRIQLTTPFGTEVYSQYTPNNQLEMVGIAKDLGEKIIPEAAYTYKKNGKWDSVTLKNGVQTEFSYDRSHLTSVVHQNSNKTESHSFRYEHDLNGNITKLTDNQQAYAFTYDPLDRISTSDMFNETYQYDKRGNRMTLTSSMTPSSKDTSMKYDERNRVQKVIKDGKEVTYKYHGEGLLYERTEKDLQTEVIETTRFYYEGDILIAEGTVQENSSDLRAVKKAEYLYGNQLVAKLSGEGAKAYYTFNGHGDVTELRGETGALLNEYSYDIWGNPVTMMEQDKDNPFLYSGEYWDNTTSLQYLRARWYDPSIGRFISEDTFKGENKNPLSLNLYTYVENNPLTHIDPSGHNKTQRAIGPPSSAGFQTGGKSGSSSGGTTTYQTYTKTHPTTGEVYTGRTSGKNTPEQNVKNRDSNHHMNKEGFGPAKLDKSSTNKDAIRGREQQLINQNGGAKSQGGSSGNKINGISPNNSKIDTYLNATKQLK